jgi:hypothetical protein
MREPHVRFDEEEDAVAALELVATLGVDLNGIMAQTPQVFLGDGPHLHLRVGDVQLTGSVIE